MRPCRLTVAFTVAAFVLGAAEKKEPAPQTVDELRAAIGKVLVETKTPGAGLAIVTRDRVVLADGIGKADVAAGRPAAADTLFRIGSVSKGFASLSILKLQEQGRLNLNDPVRKYAPDVAFQNPWEASDPIRIVHLLEHTTGWDDLHLPEYASNDPKPLTLFEGLAYHPHSRTSRWRPGTRMAYCNAGPPVAAYIVEKITGKRFEDYVQENFFGPLHMETASYLYTPAVRQHLTTLYASDGVHTAPYWHITVRPSGAVNASPRDMAAYVRFYLNRGAVDGVAIVKPESIGRMEHPESTLAARDGLRIGYGLSNYATIDDRGFANPRVQMMYFIDRIAGLTRIKLQGRSLVLAPLRGPSRTFVPVTDRLWREEKKPVPTLALISDTRDGRFLQAGAMLAIIPAWEAWGEIGGTVLVIVLLATSLLYALYWVPALLLHRLRPLRGSGLYLSVRGLPLVTVLLLLATFGVFALAGNDAIKRLGNVTVWSVSLCALTILFAVTSLLALIQAWRARAWPMRRAVLVHSILVAAACAAATIYLLYWGVIGFRTWS